MINRGELLEGPSESKTCDCVWAEEPGVLVEAELAGNCVKLRIGTMEGTTAEATLSLPGRRERIAKILLMDKTEGV